MKDLITNLISVEFIVPRRQQPAARAPYGRRGKVRWGWRLFSFPPAASGWEEGPEDGVSGAQLQSVNM